jgi:hypothetical protein
MHDYTWRSRSINHQCLGAVMCTPLSSTGFVTLLSLSIAGCNIRLQVLDYASNMPH